jgi:hypothetical protein
MALRSVKLVICALALGVMLTPNAEAANKAKKPVAPQTAAANATTCHGANLFHCGPLYNSTDYLGSDPDPFIRAMIQRDLGAKYGPSE